MLELLSIPDDKVENADSLLMNADCLGILKKKKKGSKKEVDHESKREELWNSLKGFTIFFLGNFP